jgi:MFS family permease
VLLAGWAIYAAVYLALAAADQTWQLWPIVALYGVYYAASEGVGKAFVADLVPSPQRGTAYGTYYAAIGLAALPASVAAGIAWQALGRGGLHPRVGPPRSPD